MTDIPLNLKGIGLWAPGWDSVAGFLADAPADPEVKSPKAAVLPPTLRRRASALTRAAIEAFGEAAAGAGADIHSVPTVWTSAYGEIDNTIAILDMMRGDGMPSPTRFHNSVHNTSAGTASIALKNQAFSTAIAAGDRSVQAGFIEAASILATSADEVTLVCFDEPPPAPFAPTEPWPMCAVAFHLTRPGLEDPSLPIEPRRLTLASVLAACACLDATAGEQLPLRLRRFKGSPVFPALAFLHVLPSIPDRPEVLSR